MCETAWEKGVDAPDRTKYPVWMKPSKQCTFEINGKRVYIAPKDEASLRSFLDSNTPVTNAQLQESPDGIYTWILYRSKGDPKTTKFAAARVKSVLEIGTLHRAIVYGTDAVTVHGAGELQKTGTTIDINVQSGSFMVEWKDLPDSCDLSKMGPFVLEKVKPFLSKFRVTTVHTDSFVTDAALPPTAAEIEEYKAKGLVVCEYKDETSCKKGKASCLPKGGRRKKTLRRRKKRRTTRKW